MLLLSLLLLLLLSLFITRGVLSAQVGVQRLGGVRVRHVRHPERLQRPLLPQARTQLPVDPLHGQDPLPEARNGESPAAVSALPVSKPCMPRGLELSSH